MKTHTNILLYKVYRARNELQHVIIIWNIEIENATVGKLSSWLLDLSSHAFAAAVVASSFSISILLLLSRRWPWFWLCIARSCVAAA